MIVAHAPLATEDECGMCQSCCARDLLVSHTRAFLSMPVHDADVDVERHGRSGDPFRCSLASVWQQMEALVESGLVKAIGVSNWRVKDLKQIVTTAKIQPVCK